MNETRNPYAPPDAEVADPQTELGSETLIPNGRRVPAGNGVHWMSTALRLFFQWPWKWIGVMLLLFLLSVLTAFIPLANLLATVLWPVVCGGIVFALHLQRTTGSFTVGNIFAGFGPRFAPLAIVGATMLLMYVLLFVSFAIFLGGDIARMVAGGDEIDPAVISEILSIKVLLAFLVYLLLALPIGAATYLAPPLVMLHGMKAGTAMKMSFIGLIKNILPGLLFGLVMLVLFVVSAIPFGLGLFISIPVAIISVYTVYRDIFLEEA